MSLRDSKTELGAKLGSLTPRVHVAHERESVEQNSGLVDMRALYAASVEHVRQRAQAARPRPPVVALEPVAAFVPAVDFDHDILDEDLIVVPRRRLGWLPVTVVLLALASAGGAFVANSNVPALVHARTTLAPVVVRAQTTLAPTVTRAKAIVMDGAVRAETVVVAYVDRLMGWPLPVAAPVSVQPPEAPTVTPAPPPAVPATAPPAPPVVAVALPAAVATKPATAPAPVASPPAVRSHGLAKAAPDVRATAVAPKHAASAKALARPAATAKAPAAETAPEPAPIKATASPAKAPAPATGGTDSRPMSLEDMIRQSVEAESKHKP